MELGGNNLKKIRGSGTAVNQSQGEGMMKEKREVES